MDRDIIGGLVRTTSFGRAGDDGATIILEGDTARAAFHVVDVASDPIFDSWRRKEGTRAGEADMIGERCILWKTASDNPRAKRIDIRLTGDGIPLHAARPQAPTIPVMRALHLLRRRQDPALFTLPSGIAPQDVPDLIALGRELTRKGFLPW